MFKGYDLLNNLRKSNSSFDKIIDDGLKSGDIRFFCDGEWNRIKEQNFIGYSDEMNNFYDMFVLGYNIGNCVGCSRQLSYSYNNVDIVMGRLPILKGTLNAVEVGGHSWLETRNEIIDTSLLIIINKRLKDQLGYIEEMRKTSFDLRRDEFYQARKEFVNYKAIDFNKKK